MPAIAVVMPVHNRAAIVRRAIDSVLAQDFADFELIVVDDGSSDNTREVVRSVADPRVRLVESKTNKGSNAARNRGIDATSAPLIAFLDSDDAYLPSKLGFVVRTFRQRAEVDVLLDSFTKEYPAEEARRPARRQNPVIDDNDQFIRALFNRGLWKATSAISARRETVVRAGGFDETLKRRQDFDFLIRLCAAGSCASTDKVLWTKTWTAGAISDDLRTFVSATIELCRRHPAYVTNPAFRPGLARDISRHFARLISAGRLGDATQDARLLKREFSGPRLAQLLASGSWEIARRGVAKRLRRRDRGPASRQPS